MPRPFLVAALLLCACKAHEQADGRPWVHDISLKGNKHIDSGDIKDHIALEETSWVPLSPKHYLDAPMLDVDKQRIESIYRGHGYFNARVTSVQVLPRDNGESADVKFDINEGPPSTIRELHIRGMERVAGHSHEAMLEGLWLTPGKLFEHKHYLEDKYLLQARLQAEGHAWAAVHGEARANREDHWVDIDIDVEPGPDVTFGEVRFEGDSSVNPHNLDRRVTVEPGEKFDPEVLEATRARIYNLGLFASVKVAPVQRPGHPEIADIVVSLSEGKRNEAKIGFGIGIEPQRDEVHLPMEYTRRNFFGGLRTLRLRLTPAWVWIPSFASGTRQGPAVKAEANLTQPDLLKIRDLELKTTIGYDLGVDYAFMYHGPRLSVGLDKGLFDERVHVRGSYNYQYLTFFNTEPAFLADPTKARRFFGYSNPYGLAYLLAELTVDLRDKPLDTTRGAYFWLQAEEGASWLGGGFSYQRVVPDVRVYLPLLTKRVRVAARLQYGKMYSADDSTPITRRLYLGGADSHRGFGYNRLAPQVASGSSLPPVPIGGEEALLFQGELRIDVTRLAGNWAGVVLFFDAGDVPDRGRSLDLGQLHQATGLGLRYHTLVGTIRVDLGYRLNRIDAMEADGRLNPDPGARFAFHLSLGEAF